jgi:hypothetical protein
VIQEKTVPFDDQIDLLLLQAKGGDYILCSSSFIITQWPGGTNFSTEPLCNLADFKGQALNAPFPIKGEPRNVMCDKIWLFHPSKQSDPN